MQNLAQAKVGFFKLKQFVTSATNDQLKLTAANAKNLAQLVYNAENGYYEYCQTATVEIKTGNVTMCIYPINIIYFIQFTGYVIIYIVLTK